jgi:LmbE family N-acetylglucosaminyl deacetylase
MMSEPLTLMSILAHPDDESLGFGGTLAKYSASDIETYLITATRGQIGWQGAEEENPGMKQLGNIREAELLAAAKVLGIKEVHLLDYMDGELDQAEPNAIVARLAQLLREIRPQVVITFGPDGSYGHPDHIAISQFTAAAILRAADPNYSAGNKPIHAVSKFYYRVWTLAEQNFYERVFGDLVMLVDGESRTFISWDEWAITTRIDARKYWSTVWEAVGCHQSQLPAYSAFARLTEDEHRALWGRNGYYRVFSTVNGGRKPEDDLFEGLRGPGI